jgi:hypothetical protein
MLLKAAPKHIKLIVADPSREHADKEQQEQSVLALLNLPVRQPNADA